MTNDLTDKIIVDLERSGISSEMRAIWIARQKGWCATGSVIYPDLDENKSREGDAHIAKTCTLTRDNGSVVECTFRYVLEVKKSKRPWIVLKERMNTSNNSKEELTPSSPDAWGNFIKDINVPRYELLQPLIKHALAHKNKWIGTGVHESFKTPSDYSNWYHSAIAVLKSASHIFDYYTLPKDSETSFDSSKDSNLTLVRPVIVIDGRLFSAELLEQGDITVEEIGASCLNFQFSSENYDFESSDIDLVSLSYFNEYLGICEERLTYLTESLKNV